MKEKQNMITLNRIRLFSIILSAVMAAFFIQPTPLVAADNVSTSYITPFPSGGKYKVLVIGDGFADGAFYGLAKAVSRNKKIKLYKDANYRYRLISSGRRDWIKHLDKVLNSQIFDIAVIMVGYGDRRRARVNGKSVKMDTPEWAGFYGQRVKATLRKLALRKIAVYWVGLPIVRQEKVRNQLDRINNVIKIHTSAGQVRFVDNWLHFTDENGLYNSYGPDLKGKIRLLRKRDGVFFTQAGYEKLGYYIYKFIQRDLREARAERNISLLGEKRDQDYLLTRHDMQNPRKGKLQAKAEKDKEAASKLKQFLGLSNERNKYETAKHATITLPEEATQTGKEITIKIIRPAIPAVAFTIAKRNSIQGRADRDIDGAALMQEKQGKIIGLSIASGIQQYGAGNNERRVPLTQTPYYKLVVRGDAQLSKPGRADHFQWTPAPPEKSVE